MQFIVFLVYFLFFASFVQGSAVFELKVDNLKTSSQIENPFAVVCLGPRTSDGLANVHCIFANATVNLTNLPSSNSSRFAFSWPGLFSLSLEVFSDVSNAVSLGRVLYSGFLEPNGHWLNVTRSTQLDSLEINLQFSVRLRCDQFYHNTSCSRYCAPRDDQFGHYYCSESGLKLCIDGWSGSSCDKPICRMGCHPVHGHCERPGLCQCEQGWTGPLCDQCVPHPACVHGTCDTSEFTCRCHAQWGGQFCDRDLNVCERRKPCVNGAICVNSAPDEFHCACPKLYTGRYCEKRKAFCDAETCGPHGRCNSDVIDDLLVNSTSESTAVCLCQPGFTGRRCETEINECVSSPCQHGGTCIDRLNGFDCICPALWSGSTCQLNATDCRGSPCVHASLCRPEPNFQCVCLPGFTGPFCDTDINECLSNPCANGATCIDLQNGFHCQCQLGYSGVQCERFVNACTVWSSPNGGNPCLNNGQCVSKASGGFECRCRSGFDGFYCEVDTDPCEPNPCQNGAQCYVLGLDTFFCKCKPEFVGERCENERKPCTGPDCQKIDWCTVLLSEPDTAAVRIESSGVCGAHGSCVSEAEGSFHCLCDSGYTGEFCSINVDDCAGNPCSNGGTCVDGQGSFRCYCTPGFRGDRCEERIDVCNSIESSLCQHNGTCLSTEAGEFQCRCRDGWKGHLCHLRYSHCDSTTCENGGTCLDIGDSFTCSCSVGWSGRRCTIADPPPCASSPCHQGSTCVATGASYTCHCADGFEGRFCEINVNDCALNPCLNNATCIDDVNRYTCRCAPGFTGPDCRTNVNECQSQPCAFGSQCVDLIGNFHCMCPPGRIGKLCDYVEASGLITSESDQGGPHEGGSLGIGGGSFVPSSAGGNEGRTQPSKDYLIRQRSCFFRRQWYAHEATWEWQCNICRCSNGESICEKGPMCPARTNDGIVLNRAAGLCLKEESSCGSQSTCIPLIGPDICLTPPCQPWGRCIPNWSVDSKEIGALDDLNGQISLETIREKCHSGAVELKSCVLLSLEFNLQFVPTGVMMEAACWAVGNLYPINDLRTLHIEPELHCYLRSSNSKRHVVDVYVNSIVTSQEGRDHVKSALQLAARLVSTRQVAADSAQDVLFQAVTRVFIDFNPFSSSEYEFHLWLPISCSIIGVASLLILIGLVVHHRRAQQTIVDKLLATAENAENSRNNRSCGPVEPSINLCKNSWEYLERKAGTSGLGRENEAIELNEKTKTVSETATSTEKQNILQTAVVPVIRFAKNGVVDDISKQTQTSSASLNQRPTSPSTSVSTSTIVQGNYEVVSPAKMTTTSLSSVSVIENLVDQV